MKHANTDRQQLPTIGKEVRYPSCQTLYFHLLGFTKVLDELLVLVNGLINVRIHKTSASKDVTNSAGQSGMIGRRLVSVKLDLMRPDYIFDFLMELLYICFCVN